MGATTAVGDAAAKTDILYKLKAQYPGREAEIQAHYEAIRAGLLAISRVKDYVDIMALRQTIDHFAGRPVQNHSMQELTDLLS